MRLRTFTAADMPSALNLVRQSLGESAIILSSEDHPEKRMVSVTAAVEEDDEESIIAPIVSRKSVPGPSFEATLAAAEFDMEGLRHQVQTTLRFHNLPEVFIAKLMQKASDAQLRQALAVTAAQHKDERALPRILLEKLLAGFFGFKPLPFGGKLRLMLVGAPGIGKTLTIAKLATQLAMEKKPITVITCDNKRAGGVEQLQAFTNILSLRLLVASNLADLKGYISTVATDSSLLIDTAGCNPYDADEMAELASYANVGNIEPVFAMQAGGDSMEAIDMVEAFSALPVQRILITRADTARRFGGVLASAASHGLAFSNVSSSPSVIDELQPVDAGVLAQLLLRYQLHS